jgi:hypothetical protein
MMEQNFENAKYGAERPYGIATVSMAVAIERIEKTLGSLPKLKKNFANMYEWNSLANSAVGLCLVLAREARLESQFATYVMRMALARRLPEEAVFWLTCWYQDNVQQLETLDHWKTCLPQLREQFSPTPYDLREEWAKLRQTTTLADFGQRIRTLAPLLGYGNDDCLHKFLSGMGSDTLRSELMRLQLREPVTATFTYLCNYALRLERSERQRQKEGVRSLTVVGALIRPERPKGRRRRRRRSTTVTTGALTRSEPPRRLYGCYNCGRPGHRWLDCRAARRPGSAPPGFRFPAPQLGRPGAAGPASLREEVVFSCVTGVVNDQTITFFLDSGGAVPTMSLEMVRRLGISFHYTPSRHLLADGRPAHAIGKTAPVAVCVGTRELEVVFSVMEKCVPASLGVSEMAALRGAFHFCTAEHEGSIETYDGEQIPLFRFNKLNGEPMEPWAEPGRPAPAKTEAETKEKGKNQRERKKKMMMRVEEVELEEEDSTSPSTAGRR